MILIDTNVVSELMRRAPEPAVVRWMNHQRSSLVHLAAVSIAEIHYAAVFTNRQLGYPEMP